MFRAAKTKILLLLGLIIPLIPACGPSKPNKPPEPEPERPLCDESNDSTEKCSVTVAKIAPIFSGGYAEVPLKFGEDLKKAEQAGNIKVVRSDYDIGRKLTYKVGVPATKKTDGTWIAPSKYLDGEYLSLSQAVDTLHDELRFHEYSNIHPLPDDFKVTILGRLPKGRYALYVENEEGKLVGYQPFQVNNIVNSDGNVPFLPDSTEDEKEGIELAPVNEFIDDLTYSNYTAEESSGRNGLRTPGTASPNIPGPAEAGTKGEGLSEIPNYKKQYGMRKVLLVMVEFADAKFDISQINNIKREWIASIHHRMPYSRNLNVRAFYDEISGGLLKFASVFYGPVSYPGSISEITSRNFVSNIQGIIDHMLKDDKDSNNIPDVYEIDFVDEPELHADLRSMDTIVFITPDKEYIEENCFTNPKTKKRHCNCEPDGSIKDEVCDGIDNDCDGLIDEYDTDPKSTTGAKLSCSSTAKCGNNIVEKGEACDFGKVENGTHGCHFCQKTRVYPWARHTFGNLYLGKNKTNKKNMSLITLPGNWETLRKGRKNHEILAHELGHSLGLPDLYAVHGDEVKTLGRYSLMADDYGYSNLTLPEKIQLGWIWPDNMMFVNKEPRNSYAQAFLGPINWATQSTYSPKGLLYTKETTGIEVKLTQGRSLFIEYRLGKKNGIADQEYPLSTQPADDYGQVLITEWQPNGPNLSPPQRPVAFAPNGLNEEGKAVVTPFVSRPIKNINLDYIPDLTSIADNPYLLITLNYADKDEALIRVIYKGSYVDPYIEPRPDGNFWYRTPAISVHNGRNEGAHGTDVWKNIIWPDHANEVRAVIKNNGVIDAPNVVVNFYEHDYTVEKYPDRRLIGTTTVDIGANRETIASIKNWRPARGGHYCITVEIEPYKTDFAGKQLEELSSDNNSARSNFEALFSSSASPATRVSTVVTVKNPYDVPTTIHLSANHNSNDFRTYLSRRTVYLDAHEETKVKISTEYRGDDYEKRYHMSDGMYRGVVHTSLRAIAEIPPRAGAFEIATEVLDGVDTVVYAGIATHIVTLENLLEANSGIFRFKGCVTKERLIKGEFYARDQCEGDKAINEGDLLVSIYFEGEKFPLEIRVPLKDTPIFEFNEHYPKTITHVDLEYTGSHPYSPRLQSYKN